MRQRKETLDVGQKSCSTQAMRSLFRYSGSKARLIKHLPAPPVGTEAIVEPFAGSLAYGLNYRPDQLLACEANSDVRRLIEWLVNQATEADLAALEAKKPADKVDVRSLGLGPEEQTLMRLMISGAYTGQLNSFLIYPQHSFDLQHLKEMLPYLQTSVRLVGDDFAQGLDVQDMVDNAFYFIDPPYVGTSGGYQDKTAKKSLNEGVSADALTEFCHKLKHPFLFTYGDGAQETYPAFEWHLACVRKVPILRGGGTRDRHEYFATRFK